MNVKEFWMKTDTEFSNPPSLEWAEKFAALIAAAEREACARVAAWILKMPENDVSAAIRGRGEK